MICIFVCMHLCSARLPAVNHSANQSSFCDACVVPDACAVTGPTLALSVMFGAPVLVSLSDSEAGEISPSGSHKAISGICISFSRYETYNVGDLDSTAWFYKAVFFFFLTRFVMSKRTHFKHSLSVITCQRILFKTFEKGKYSGRYLFVFYTRLRSYREQGYINKQLIIYYYYLLSMLAAHICGMCHLSVN